MAAVGGPAVPLGRAAGLAAAPVAAVAAPVAAVAGPGGLVPFNVVNVLAGATIPGYELSWANYDTQLRASLTTNYPLVEPEARAPRVPVVAPGADPVPIELTRIKAYLNDAANPTRKPPGWDSGRLNGAVNKARDSPAVAALGAAVPFDVNAYRVAILASLNANAAPLGFNYRGVGP